MEDVAIAAAQTASIAGDIAANVAGHVRFAAAAGELGVKLLVLPELSLTGHPPPRGSGVSLIGPRTQEWSPIAEGTVQRINGLRVIAGGLLAGVVINICEFIVNGVILKNRWAAAMRALGKPAGYGATEMTAFILWGFLVGIFAIWLYAAIRPRYGPGPKTAAVAGVAVWVLGYLLPSIPTVVTHLFGRRLVVYGVAVGLVEAVGGTMLGAWLYREPKASTVPSSAAAEQ